MTRHVSDFLLWSTTLEDTMGQHGSQIQDRGNRGFKRAMLTPPLCSNVPLTTDFFSRNSDGKTPANSAAYSRPLRGLFELRNVITATPTTIWASADGADPGEGRQGREQGS